MVAVGKMALGCRAHRPREIVGGFPSSASALRKNALFDASFR